jgi:hypothetical protein
MRAIAPFVILFSFAVALAGPPNGWAESSTIDKVAVARLPLATTFQGEQRFHEIVAKSRTEKWADLAMGPRIIKFARELHGVPYSSFTLEIDDHIEAPSANLVGLDCWTFFEVCLGMARMIESKQDSYQPTDLLAQIEFTRYRGGKCHGDYLDRIHYLAEWFFENEARGTCDDITRDLGGAQLMTGRKCREMTVLWKSYRYLKNNPELRPLMSRSETEVSSLPVYYIPKSKVAAIESKLQDGDVIGIVTNQQGGFCSHVGVAIRTDDGVLRLMHASSNYKKVVIDKSLSGYLNSFKYHAGIIVGRPLEVSKTITDDATYRANLARLTSAR